jgi:hypothetical protein
MPVSSTHIEECQMFLELVECYFWLQFWRALSRISAGIPSILTEVFVDFFNSFGQFPGEYHNWATTRLFHIFSNSLFTNRRTIRRSVFLDTDNVIIKPIIINAINKCLSVIMQVKGKAIPVTGRGGPQGCETSRLSHFLDNRLTDGDKVISPLPSSNLPGTHFC